MLNNSRSSKIHGADSQPARAGTKRKWPGFGVGIFLFVFACGCIFLTPILLITEGDSVESLVPITEYSGYATALKAVWSPDGSRIVATLNEGKGSGIYSMNIDGSEVVHLTPNFLFSSVKYDPAWSSDGRYILYFNSTWLNESDIYRMNADGSNPINLTENDFRDGVFGLSPDAQHIAFVSARRTPDDPNVYDNDIYTMDLDGLNVTRLTSTTRNVGPPIWSPDGRHIGFVSAGDTLQAKDIYVMDTDGSNMTQLTNIHGVQNFSWSPDSKKLAFSSTNSKLYDGYIYFVDLNGENMTQLPGAPKGTHPAWSPDGAQLAFCSNDGIYIFNPDKGNVELLTSASYPSSLSWSPDGKLIIFTSGFAIFVMNADGANKAQLTSLPSP